MKAARERLSHTLFEASLFVRGGLAVFQFLVAFLIYSHQSRQFFGLVRRLAVPAVNNDSHRIISTALHHMPHITPAGRNFAALFFLVCAIMNALLVGGLLSKRPFLFQLSEIVIAAFALYQILLFSRTLSWWLIALTIYDGAMIYLISLEYRRRFVDPAHRKLG